MTVKKSIQTMLVIALTIPGLAFSCPEHGCSDCGGETVPQKKKSSTEQYWIRPAKKGQNTAAYLSSYDELEVTDELVAVSATPDVAKAIELHDHINDKGVMKMRPVSAIVVEKGKTIMEPGGKHIMLLGLTQDLKSGDKIQFSLTFKKSGQKNVAFIVR